VVLFVFHCLMHRGHLHIPQLDSQKTRLEEWQEAQNPLGESFLIYYCSIHSSKNYRERGRGWRWPPCLVHQQMPMREQICEELDAPRSLRRWTDARSVDVRVTMSSNPTSKPAPSSYKPIPRKLKQVTLLNQSASRPRTPVRRLIEETGFAFLLKRAYSSRHPNAATDLDAMSLQP
jgi:hypothetical protein